MKTAIESEKLAKVIARALIDDSFKMALMTSPQETLHNNDVVIPDGLTVRVEDSNITGTISSPTEYIIHLPKNVESLSIEEVEHFSNTLDFGPTTALPLCAVYLED